MTLIVDYGVGNSGSVMHALRRLGESACVSGKISDIQKAERIILPGVGAFDSAMSRLQPLVSVLTDKVLGQKCPVLGICLGMQVFAERSEEGQALGLGWIPGSVKRMVGDQPIPHMGWSSVHGRKNSPLFPGANSDHWFYFVHSFYFSPTSMDCVVGTSCYGQEFAAAIQKENIFGVQFHPEKSHQDGLALLQNFLEYRG